MSYVMGTTLGEAFKNALGIDLKGVKSITLHADASEVATLTLVKFVTLEECRVIEETIEKMGLRAVPLPSETDGNAEKKEGV